MKRPSTILAMSNLCAGMRGFFVLLCSLAMSPIAHGQEGPVPPPLQENLSSPAAEPSLPVRNVLIYALSQLGVTYRYGGGNTQGFDCSGFVRHVFSRAADMALPHNSRAMSHYGSEVPLSRLQPGDLVFFRIQRHKISHVGIYIGNQHFIHAASSRSGDVMISDLRDHYWATRLASARHLPLGEPTPSDVLSPSVLPPQ